MPWPKRTGLPTLKYLLRKVCLLVAKFRPLWVDLLDANDVALIDALVVKCEEVTEQVPTYEPPA